MSDERAGLGLRAAAAVVDLALMGFAGVAAGGALGVVIGTGSGTGGAAESAALAGALGFAGGALAGGLAAVLSYSLIEGITGTSPGKRLCGLRVARPDGTPATRRGYLARWAAKYGALLVLVLSVLSGSELAALAARATAVVTIAGCALAMGDHKQALHDLAAGTAVYRLRP